MKTNPKLYVTFFILNQQIINQRRGQINIEIIKKKMRYHQILGTNKPLKFTGQSSNVILPRFEIRVLDT